MQNPNEPPKWGKRSKANSNGYDWIGSTNYLAGGENTFSIAMSRVYPTIWKIEQFIPKLANPPLRIHAIHYSYQGVG